MKLSWWKWLSVALVLYTLIAGLIMKVPALPILHETIRNLYFHVTMWFAMILILLGSLVYSIRFLANGKTEYDIKASETANIGIILGLMGIATGAVWARSTWGAWWANDAKLNGAAVTLLFYFAYLILRNSIEDPEKKARISAVYNVFAYVMLIVFLMILPRMTDSLHPGNGGNPGFGGYDLDNSMKLVFYPAIIGWTLFGCWMADLRIRTAKLNLEESNQTDHATSGNG
jgi:heme exporter protein C